MRIVRDPLVVSHLLAYPLAMLDIVSNKSRAQLFNTLLLGIKC